MWRVTTTSSSTGLKIGSAFDFLFYLFFLQAGEIDKARAVGRRALRTIAFREEGEKLNVWVALLNIENLYGTQVSVLLSSEGT